MIEAMSAWNVGLALPEWILTATALVALFYDARSPADDKKESIKWVWFGLLAATACVVIEWMGMKTGEKAWAFRGHFGFDAFSALLKTLFGLTAMMVLSIADHWLKRVDRGHAEFHLLTIFATLGMFFVCSVEDFAGLFVALELITISFFCLTAFKRNDERAIEAGIKYVVLGAIASSFLLFGIAFLYGATGSLRLDALGGVAEAFAHGGEDAPLLNFGLLLVIIGLGFKIAAVPFQVWTPDVYEGAATPVTAFLSMGSKAAGVTLLMKVARACLGDGAAGLATAAPWIIFIVVIAAATILYGSLGAMFQTNIKRLLGYSSIGHAGYILMGFAAFDQAGFAAIVYYLMAYLFTVIAVFAVVVIVNGVIRSHRIEDYSGLARRSPLLGFVLTCGLLSLAGVPPFAGFFGKFLVFRALIAKAGALGDMGPDYAAASVSTYTLAFIGAAGVVISLYYYLMVVKRIYMDAPPEGSEEQPIVAPQRLKGLLYACLAGIFLLGMVMGPFMALAESAAAALVAVH